MELNRIYQIDVLEGLRQLPDESVDLIITSPPYNKGKRGYKKHIKIVILLGCEMPNFLCNYTYLSLLKDKQLLKKKTL